MQPERMKTMTLQWHRTMDASGASPWHATSDDRDAVRSQRLSIALDGLLVSVLVVVAFAVHW
jgi:hypothetical protein